MGRKCAFLKQLIVCLRGHMLFQNQRRAACVIEEVKITSFLSLPDSGHSHQGIIFDFLGFFFFFTFFQLLLFPLFSFVNYLPDFSTNPLWCRGPESLNYIYNRGNQHKPFAIYWFKTWFCAFNLSKLFMQCMVMLCTKLPSSTVW